MDTSNNFLETEPVGPLLKRLAIPTVAAQFINMLYNIVDRIYIGHIPVTGSLALTGVGVCLPLILIISTFSATVSSGGAPLSSIELGKKDNAQAENILGSCFLLQLIVSAVLTAVLLLFGKPMLLAFGASDKTISYALRYMNIYALGTVFVQLTLGMNAFIVAQGFARTGMYAVMVGAVSNIILDPVFIFLFRLGVAGAAWATVLSQALSCLFVLSFLRGGRTVIRIRRGRMRIRKDILLPCLQLGFAPFVMQSSESILSVCFNSSLLRYGGDIAVGAMTILSSVAQFIMLPLHGFGQGAQPIISYNYGAGNPGRVRTAFRILLKTCFTYSAFFWCLVMLLPGLFAGIFTSDPKLLSFASQAMRLYCGAMFLFGILTSCQSTFTALGCPKESASIAVLRKFILLIPLIYILPQVLPGDRTSAVYLAEPVADVISITYAALIFKKKFTEVLSPR